MEHLASRLSDKSCVPVSRPNRYSTTAPRASWLSPSTWRSLRGDMFEAYRDRREAGQCLGRELLRTLPTLLRQHGAPAAAEVNINDVVVLGLVRGGMPVAEAVVQALGSAKLDAFVVRKVGAPLQPEFGIGAIAECGHTTTTIINEAAVEAVGATQQQLQDTIDSKRQELQRRVQAYRQGRPHLPVAGKVVVLVDDGLATGVTARAAAEAMRVEGAAVVVLAVPVGAAHTVAELQQQRVADFVVCLRTPKHFRAVGAHYQDFSQTTDQEVVDILSRYHHPDAPGTPTAGTAAAAAAAAEQSPVLPQHPAVQHADDGAGSSGTGTSAAAVAAPAGGPLTISTAGPSSQGPTHPHHTPTTPARTSSLAAALEHSPEVSPTAAAAAATAAGLKPVSGDEVVIVDNALGVQLHGSLTVPVGAHGLVVFAHGSGSSRNSPRNRQVAATLNMAGLATLLFDLLSEHEAQQRHNVFDIALLASRLQLAVDWLEAEGTAGAGRCPPDFPLGFFGASTGGGAALWAAAYLGPRVSAVVVRGGRPDLARAKLPAVTAPTLLLVGGEDTHVLELNQLALQMMGASDSSQIVVVPEAGHLFEGPGQLEQVAELAVQWFRSHMGKEGEAECGVLPKLMD